MVDTTYVLVGFGIIALAALIYLIYRQMQSDDKEEEKQESAKEDVPESDSYYDDSEVYTE